MNANSPQRHRVSDWIALAGWLPRYRIEWLSHDVVAGLTAAAIVIPKAMAYATIAGLPVQVGLYTVFVPMTIYAVFGTAASLSVSTTTTIAILAAAALGEIGAATPAELIVAASTLSLLVGIFLLLACALRLGFIANFISEPVLIGFKSGIALVIVVDQLPKLLGIHIEKTGFLRDIFSIVQNLPHTVLATLAFTVAILLLIFLLERYASRAPAPLLAVAVGIFASMALNLQSFGVETIGSVEGGLPALTKPRLDLFAVLWPAAVGIALMSFTESIAAARAFARTGEPRPAPNQELLAIGFANAGGALFGAMPAGGGTTQTAVNSKAGARTQLAELITAAAAIATLLLLAPLLAPMPHAVLAAVVVAYSIDLIQPREFKEILKVRRVEFIWAVIAFAGVIMLGTLKGILVAVLASLVALAHQAYNPPVDVLGRKRGTDVFRPLSADHPNDQTWPRLLMVRVVGRAFFANAQSIGERLLQLIEEQKPIVLLLDCSALIDLEYTALRMLTEAEERLRANGIELWLAAPLPGVLNMVERSTLGDALGRERIFLSAQIAVAHYEELHPTHLLSEPDSSQQLHRMRGHYE